MQRLKAILSHSFFSQVKSSFIYQALGAVVAFGSQILIARMVGVELFGLYTLGISWLTMSGIFSKLGLDAGVVRFMPKFLVDKNYQALISYYKKSYKIIIGSSLLIAIILISVVQLNILSLNPAKTLIITLMLLALPFRSLLDLNNSYFQVNKKFGWAITPRSVFLPLLFIVVIAIFYSLKYEINPHVIAYAYIAISAMVFIVSALKLRQETRQLPKEGENINFKSIFKVCVVLSLVNGVSFFYKEMDVLMLGFLSTEESLGWYGAMIKITLLLNIVLNAVNLVVAPDIAKHYKAQNRKALQTLLSRTSKLLLAVSVVIAIVIVALGKWVLGLFGPSYVAMYIPLLILSGGQLFNTITGPVGFLLSMTNYERELFIITVISLMINFGLNLYLIPLYDVMGAAIATAISIVLRNLIVTIYARVKLKIKPTIFF